MNRANDLTPRPAPDLTAAIRASRPVAKPDPAHRRALACALRERAALGPPTEIQIWPIRRSVVVLAASLFILAAGTDVLRRGGFILENSPQEWTELGFARETSTHPGKLRETFPGLRQGIRSSVWADVAAAISERNRLSELVSQKAPSDLQEDPFPVKRRYQQHP